MSLEPLTIELRFFNNHELIGKRILDAPPIDQGSLRTALFYLYMDDGPINLPRDRKNKAELYLTQEEKLVVRWLSTRTNGSLRKEYGTKALIAARTARYRCNHCGYSDVRTLNLDHIDGRVENTDFDCLCANCHAIKSRKQDWTGERSSDTE